ncbi:transcriptional regulator [Flagellimonas allohymeniacidonis]|uniref:Transcriptional regulator n=1 Tax=Flagellimonas allohymeniacidonis TaxID=2517819 RepID=A0A4Q8QES4_9FLAO|nr:transcriptional regulator [Allomuricauda hymeniacidonis]TAI48137.1 transcriptional regulator [Allomuricauda hymeniacidonis]
MIAVLTGDIINSREDKSPNWLIALKEGLNQYGKEPQDWEIYRGDSFQLETTPSKALQAAIHIKAAIKQSKNIDVRIAIGLGDKTYTSEKITESNGTAFIHSGECFERLKKKNLALKSTNTEFDQRINLLIELALLTLDHWSPAIAKTVKTAMENPDLKQSELAALLGKSQGNISEELNRAGFEEVQKMISTYQNEIQNL